LLIVGSTVQIAAAADRYTYKSDRARVHATEQFRKANDSLISPSVQQTTIARPCDLGAGRSVMPPDNAKSPACAGFFVIWGVWVC
jgi:hypothetical protein